MQSNKPFYVFLVLASLFSFLGIPTDLPFIPEAKHSWYIAGRVFCGLANLTLLALLFFKKHKKEQLVVPFLIVMMIYCFHGQMFMPCYYLGYMEIVLIVGLFFPIKKIEYRTITTISCIILGIIIYQSPATYNPHDPLIDSKFRYDAFMGVLLMTIGSMLGHKYITMKQEEKDEAYRKFMDIGKYSSFLFHDFKGLLSTPIFYAEMLSSTIKSGGSPTEILERLTEDLAFMQQYAKEIMKLTLPDNKNYYQKELINMPEISRTLNILLRKQLVGVNLQVEVTGVQTKTVDNLKMLKVFYNGVLNSVEQLKTNQISNPTISILLDNDVVKIKDNGQGFPVEILKKLNQEDVMVSTKENGSGIGTAIIKDLVRNMDGAISFYNDKGAVINIKF